MEEATVEATDLQPSKLLHSVQPTGQLKKEVEQRDGSSQFDVTLNTLMKKQDNPNRLSLFSHVIPPPATQQNEGGEEKPLILAGAV